MEWIGSKGKEGGGGERRGKDGLAYSCPSQHRDGPVLYSTAGYLPKNRIKNLTSEVRSHCLTAMNTSQTQTDVSYCKF